MSYLQIKFRSTVGWFGAQGRRKERWSRRDVKRVQPKIFLKLFGGRAEDV